MAMVSEKNAEGFLRPGRMNAEVRRGGETTAVSYNRAQGLYTIPPPDPRPQTPDPILLHQQHLACENRAPGSALKSLDNDLIKIHTGSKIAAVE